MARASPSSSGHQAGPTLARRPFCHRATHTHRALTQPGTVWSCPSSSCSSPSYPSQERRTSCSVLGAQWTRDLSVSLRIEVLIPPVVNQFLSKFGEVKNIQTPLLDLIALGQRLSGGSYCLSPSQWGLAQSPRTPVLWSAAQ